MLAACGEPELFARGVAQKGPFAPGASVLVELLDPSLRAHGQVYTGQIEDALGRFAMDSPMQQRFANISVSGYAFNEGAGDVFAAPLQLRAVAELASGPTDAGASVNVLTHLQAGRLQKLVASGLSFADAEAQSRAEVLSVFKLKAEEVEQPFSRIDLTAGGNAAALLLAVSATLIYAGEPGLMTGCCVDAAWGSRVQIVTDALSLEIANSGHCDDASLLQKIASAQSALAVAQPGAQIGFVGDPNYNLHQFYAAHGVEIPALDWKPFIDGNGDGTVDKY